MRPVLDYKSYVCDPQGTALQEKLKKRAEVRSEICNRELQLTNWEYDWRSWTVKMGIPQRPTDDLIHLPQSGTNQRTMALQILWLELIFIKIASIHRLRIIKTSQFPS